ncbi:hypothetical protein AHAS_Ahas02G0174900 [Arachis hypogaea]
MNNQSNLLPHRSPVEEEGHEKGLRPEDILADEDHRYGSEEKNYEMKTKEKPLGPPLELEVPLQPPPALPEKEKYDNTVKECTKALDLNPVYIKALVRRGEAHEKLEHFEEAIADMKKILEIDPSNDQARKAIRRLEPLAAEKREMMKR